MADELLNIDVFAPGCIGSQFFSANPCRDAMDTNYGLANTDQWQLKL